MTTVSRAVLSDRRRRYEPGNPQYGMTISKERLLLYIAECGMLTTDQAARISGISKKAAYNHLRGLFDLGLAGRVPIPYADLAPREADGPSLVWGPGENVHIPTREGMRWLASKALISEEEAKRKLPEYGPKNKLFLAHELLVRDIRVWLELCARVHGGRVEQSVFGTAAHILPARPDGWFVYELPNGKALVVFAEADRANQFGSQWKEKAAGYAQVMGTDAMAEATGGKRRARVLAVTVDEKRRDWICNQVAGTPAADWTFCCVRPDLLAGGLAHPFWQRPGREGAQQLLPDNLLLNRVTTEL